MYIHIHTHTCMRINVFKCLRISTSVHICISMYMNTFIHPFSRRKSMREYTLQRTATHCNTLQKNTGLVLQDVRANANSIISGTGEQRGMRTHFKRSPVEV